MPLTVQQPIHDYSLHCAEDTPEEIVTFSIQLGWLLYSYQGVGWSLSLRDSESNPWPRHWLAITAVRYSTDCTTRLLCLLEIGLLSWMQGSKSLYASAQKRWCGGPHHTVTSFQSWFCGEPIRSSTQEDGQSFQESDVLFSLLWMLYVSPWGLSLSDHIILGASRSRDLPLNEHYC